MRYEVEYAHKQQYRLSHSLIRHFQLLELPYAVLIPFLNKIILDNPFLDLDCCAEAEYEHMIARLETDKEWDFGEKKGDRRYDVDGVDPASLMRVEDSISTLQGYLRLQLEGCNLSKDYKRIGLFLIECIDENGYLLDPVEELAKVGEFSIESCLHVISILKGFEPNGVFASDLCECLLLQIPKDNQYYSQLMTLLTDESDALARRDMRQLSKVCGLSPRKTQALLAYLAGLNPAPGLMYHSRYDPIPYVLPDIEVRIAHDGHFQVKCRGGAGIVRVNRDYYQSLAHTSCLDEETRDYIRSGYRKAKELSSIISMRQTTMEKMALCIIEEQRGFFEKGPSAMKPFSMRRLAQMLEVHPSTVGRCVKDKYIQTPHGLFPVSFFFSSALEMEDGKEVSSNAIRERIREIVCTEEPGHPLSDTAIAERLEQEGYSVSRRTVTKYREQLKILPKQLRRQKGSEGYAV